jgi:hypothetical protein
MSRYDRHLRAARIVREAGGELVGRTRLQKVVYLTQLAGFGDEFDFEYRHYGPFSEDLATGMEIAAGLHVVEEEEKRADWGGWYSIYRVTAETPAAESSARSGFIAAASKLGAVELELAATAAFLYSKEGIRPPQGDPWDATRQLKPDKANNGRLELAKAAYRKLRKLQTPLKLPPIA